MDLDDIFDKDFGSTQHQEQDGTRGQDTGAKTNREISLQKYEGYEGTLLLRRK